MASHTINVTAADRQLERAEKPNIGGGTI